MTQVKWCQKCFGKYVGDSCPNCADQAEKTEKKVWNKEDKKKPFKEKPVGKDVAP
jgi:hypothetical protein